MSNEIKIGDTVDCSGWNCGKATCKGGNVTKIGHQIRDFLVEGGWTDDSDRHWVRPDQITRHVPAAPVVERPASIGTCSECHKSVGITIGGVCGGCRENKYGKPRYVGDKLASEMTVREKWIGHMVALFRENLPMNEAIDDAISVADALIAALDKERT